MQELQVHKRINGARNERAQETKEVSHIFWGFKSSAMEDYPHRVTS
jgi:hypothetical protein